MPCPAWLPGKASSLGLRAGLFDQAPEGGSVIRFPTHLRLVRLQNSVVEILEENDFTSRVRNLYSPRIAGVDALARPERRSVGRLPTGLGRMRLAGDITQPV